MALYRCGGEVLTPLSPNFNAPRIVRGGKYRATSGGYAIGSYNNLIPSNTDIPSLSPKFYQCNGNGYAIASYSNETPDDTDPPYVEEGDIIKVWGYGYLYATRQTSGFPYTKSGTLSDFSSANQEKIVNTGLTSVTYFYIEGYANNGAVFQASWLDTTRSFAKQIAVYTGGTGGTVLASGTDPAGVITGTSAGLKVSGISGGVITVKTGNSSTYLSKNVKWYAG